jgi:hypothetical protein
MAGRALVHWDPVKVELIKQHFVAVSVDGKPLVNRKDAEGDFIRACGYRTGEDSGGFFCVTASGKNLSRDGDVVAALKAWNQLPEAERRPGAITVADITFDPRFVQATPPPGGLIIKIYGRHLTRTPEGGLRRAVHDDFPQLKGREQPERFNHIVEGSRDYLWLTEAEWKSLLPPNPRVGDQMPLPPRIIRRIFNFHVDPGRQLGQQSGRRFASDGRDLRAAEATLTVEAVSPERVRLRVNGSGRLQREETLTNPHYETGKFVHTLEARLQGILEYDRKKQAFTRFDLVVLGDFDGRVWNANAGSPTFSDRPGRHPIGFAFELVQDPSPLDQLPPTGSMTPEKLEREYFGKDR